MKLMVRMVAVLSAIALLSGCVSSRIEQSRTARTGMSSEDALVILGRASYNDRETEASFTECLNEAVGEGRDPLRLVSEIEFKDLMYPWFEPRTAPTNVDELVKLFAHPGVRDQIEASQVRYIAWINGDTVTTGKGGSLA